MTYFHSIFYNISIVKFPSYLSRFNSSSLRHCHLDNLSIQSSVHPKVPQNLEAEVPTTGITKSFFYRAHSAWNKLPLEIRKIESPVYRSPSSNYSKFIDRLDLYLKNLEQHKNKLIHLVGDFNVDLAKYDSDLHCHDLINKMAEYCFAEIISIPTRITAPTTLQRSLTTYTVITYIP